MPEPENPKEIEEGRFFALISYITFLCIVALALKKDNRFAVYHAKQGLVIFVLEVVVMILSVIPVLGSVIQYAGFIVFALLSLWCIFQVLLGNYPRVPVISEIADKIIL